MSWVTHQAAHRKSGASDRLEAPEQPVRKPRAKADVPPEPEQEEDADVDL